MPGHFEYSGVRVFASTLEISRNPVVRERWPTLAQRLEEVGHSILNIEHVMDWDITRTEPLNMSDQDFEQAAIALLIGSAKGDYDNGSVEPAIA